MGYTRTPNVSLRNSHPLCPRPTHELTNPSARTPSEIRTGRLDARRSSEQGEQLGTRPVDVAGCAAGVVERDHFAQRGAELLAGRRVLVVQFRRVLAPAGGNVPDRQ